MTGRRSNILLAGLIAVSSVTPAVACDALKGTTAWDSVWTTYGDPFFGGAWANARGGSAYIQRTLTKPATVSGFFMRAGGSDVTADGSILTVKVRRKSDGAWQTVFDLRNAVVGRDFSGGASPRRLAPVTVTFPDVEVTALRIAMSGHGWFALDQTLFFVRGCSS